MIGEKRLRVWLIYMAGSAHAFGRGWMSIYQLLGMKPLPGGGSSHPLTRSHVYSG
jgi:cyclopropane-fatty-acyl-phospholipid synthase